MTYADALQTGEWKRFRQEFVKSKTHQDWGAECEDCGTDTPYGSLHVHHKIYRKGLLPWEYGFEDLRLVCKSCHEAIHIAEEACRQFIRTLPPHVCHEFYDFVLELSSIKDPRVVKVALARAKNFAREL